MQAKSVLGAFRTFGSGAEPTPSPVRVLVVDDEEPIRGFVQRVLRAAGYETVAAASGRDALALAAGGGFDIVITDVRMPGMSGPEFVQTLRRTERDITVLYLTGYNEQLFNQRTTLWKDEAFLDKPFSVNGLLEAVSLLTHDRLPAARPA